MPEHADPVQAQVLLPRIVVDETDRRVPEDRALQHLADDELAGVAGPDDQGFFSAGDDPSSAWTLDQRPRQEADAADQGDQDQEVHDDDGARQANTGNRIGQVDRDQREERGGGHASSHRPHVPDRDVPPPVVVEAERHERRDLDAEHEQDRPLEEAVVDEGHTGVEAEVEGEIPRQSDEARVDNDLPDPVPVDESHQV